MNCNAFAIHLQFTYAINLRLQNLVCYTFATGYNFFKYFLLYSNYSSNSQTSCILYIQGLSSRLSGLQIDISQPQFEISICSIFSAVLYLLLHYSLTVLFPCNFLFCKFGDFCINQVIFGQI